MFKQHRITALLMSLMMILVSLFDVAPVFAMSEYPTEEPLPAESVQEAEEAMDEMLPNETETEDTILEETEEEIVEESSEAQVEEIQQVIIEEPAAGAMEEAEEAEEAPAEVPFEESATVQGVKITVTAEAGVFPEGATLRVKNLSSREEAKVEAAVEKVADEAEVAAQYNFDIAVVDGEGNELQPDTTKGEVKVAFATEEVADESLQAEVFHINENGKAESLDVETEGEVAEVAVDGFSPYSLRFTFYNEQTHEQGVYELRVGTSINANLIAEAVGLSGHGNVVAASSNTGNVEITSFGGNFYVEAEAGWNGTSNFALELRFEDGHQDAIRIRCHAHNWNFTASGAIATLKCVPGENDSCYYKGTYTKTIVAGDATYNGAQHGAHLEGNMGDIDVHIGDIHYASGHNNPSGGSTTAPINAGNYTAYVTISADQVGGNVSRTIYTNFTINKASINLSDATARVLTYNGLNQGLYNLAYAQSATTSQTFDVMYRYSDSTSWNEDHVLSGKNAGTYTIKYKAFGDANHYDSAEKTVVCTIGTRPVYFNGLTAQNRIYNQRTNATINYSGLTVYEVVSGEALTVTVTGTFNNKNAGENKPVTLSNFQLHAGNTATDINNYHINTSLCQTGTTATIFKKEMRIDWQNAMDFQYNGEPQSPTPVKKPGNATRDDDYLVYAGDEVNVGVTAASPKTNVGNNYEAFVTILGGADAGNYYLPDSYSAVGAKFNIVPRKIDVQWSNTTQEYNDAVLAPTVALTDSVALNEGVGVVLTTPTDAREAGTYSDAAQLTGENKGNFTINPYTLTHTFTITKAPLRVSASGWLYYGDTIDKVMDEKYEYVSGLKGDDTLAVLKHTGDFRTDYGSKYDLVDPITDEDHTYTLLPVFENADNYEVINVDGELTVYPKPVVLEWTHTHAGESEEAVNDAEFVYDGKMHSYSAVVSQDSYVRVHGRIIDDEILVTLQDEVERDANVKTGTTKYLAKAMSLSDPNYSLRYKDGTAVETKTVSFKIDQRPVILSWTPDTFVYNAYAQIPELTIENLQFNDEEVQDEAFVIQRATVENSEVFNPDRKDASIEVGEYTVSAVNEESGYLLDENYTLVGGEGTSFDYTITKAPLNVKATGWITYGEIAEEDVLRMSDDNAGTDIAYLHMEGDQEVEGLLGEDTVEAEIMIDETDGLTYESDYEQFDDVTTAEKAYSIAIADGMTSHNYELSFVDDELKVFPLPAVLVWTDEEGTLLEDEDLPTYIYDGKAHGVVAVVENVLNGDVVKGQEYTENNIKDANAKTGTEKYTAVVTKLDSINYTLLADPKHDEETLVEGREWSFKIDPRVVEISGWKFGETVYNGKNQTNAYTFANLVKGDKDTLVVNNHIQKNAGTYTAEITAIEDKNYTLEGTDPETLTKTWTIKPLPVVLTWTNGKLIYNGKTQKVTATVKNLCAGDKITITYSDNAKKDAGSYTAKATKLSNPNYTLVGGTNTSYAWKISPLPVVLKWSNSNLTYNGKDQKVVATISNLCAGDKVGITYIGNIKKDAGSYTAKATKLSNPNYTLTGGSKLSNAWKINKAPLTITAKNRTIFYGDKPVNNGVAYAGLKGNDTAKVLGGKLVYKYNYAQYGKPGSYTITPSGLTAKNYKITFKAGTLKVNDKVNVTMARAIAKGSDKAKINWNKVTGAKSYEVWIAQCNSSSGKSALKKVATITDGSRTFTVTNLEPNTAYKFRVVAKTNSSSISSATGHFVTGNVRGSKTNPSGMSLDSHAFTIKKGKTAQIKGVVTSVRSDKSLMGHTAFLRFVSTNTKVATVDANGMIKGVSKGWCTIYVFTENGIWNTVDVTVK